MLNVVTMNIECVRNWFECSCNTFSLGLHEFWMRLQWILNERAINFEYACKEYWMHLYSILNEIAINFEYVWMDLKCFCNKLNARSINFQCVYN